jgi:hypothetical protein
MRYLINVTEADADRLESWLGSKVQIVPFLPEEDLLADLRVGDGHVPDYNLAEADRRLERVRPVDITGLDAVSEEEVASIKQRLRSGGPLYHAGGPGKRRP